MSDEGDNQTSQGWRNVKETLWQKPQNDCKMRGEVRIASRKVAFTLAEGATHVAHSNNLHKAAFTLAEVLITLGIIGVIAALTLPTVIQDYQKQDTVAKLKKAYAALGQVVQKAVADNGSVDIVPENDIDADVVENFFNTYWLPYFKGANVLPDNNSIRLNKGKNQYKYKNGELQVLSIFTRYRHGRIFFTTADGMSYFIIFGAWKNGNPIYSMTHFVYVDLNGVKPPNTFGKDVFVFTVDFQKGLVRPIGYSYTDKAIYDNCKEYGTYCVTKIIRDGWQIKEDYPW